MPELKNRRHEWFAQLRAQGLRMEDAYERAGYAPDRSHACRLASRADVAQRINEYRAYYNDAVTAHRPQMIAALLDLATTSLALGTPTAIKEARMAYISAARLQERIAQDLARDRQIIERQLGTLTPRERHRGLPAAVETAGDPGPAPVYDDVFEVPIDTCRVTLAKEGATAGIAARALALSEALTAHGVDLGDRQVIGQ